MSSKYRKFYGSDVVWDVLTAYENGEESAKENVDVSMGFDQNLDDPRQKFCMRCGARLKDSF